MRIKTAVNRTRWQLRFRTIIAASHHPDDVEGFQAEYTLIVVTTGDGTVPLI